MTKKIELFVCFGLGLFILAGCGKVNLPGQAPARTPIPTQTLFSPSEIPVREEVIVTITPASPTETELPPTPTPTLIPTLPPAGDFVDRGQRLGLGWEIGLGDLDDDSDLDAVFFDYNHNNTVWLNDGQGHFTATGQQPGYSFRGALGDLDGDGDLDIFNVDVPHRGSVWLNDGSGQFGDSGQELTTRGCFKATLGDLDGDGDLDAYVACAEADSVWKNDGAGFFTSTGQRLGSAPTVAAALIDLDSDGDLDVFTGGWDEPQKLWLNNGKAEFVDSGQRIALPTTHIHAVALGDLDDDGDLDAFLGLAGPAGCQVMRNDGAGVFSNWGPMLESQLTHSVALGDLDGDGDLDAVTAHGQSDMGNGSGGRIWINDGTGRFQPQAATLGEAFSGAATLGDLDGNGNLDIVLSHGDQPVPAEVWLNQQAAVPTAP